MDDHLQGWPLQGGATTEQYNPYQCLWIKGWQLWQSSCRSALERLLLDSMETSLQLSILYFYFISQQLQFRLTRLPVLFDKQYINAVFLYSEKAMRWQLPSRAPNRVLITGKIILWRIFGRQPTEFWIQKWKMHILNNFSGFWCSWESVWWQETMTCDH